MAAKKKSRTTKKELEKKFEKELEHKIEKIVEKRVKHYFEDYKKSKTFSKSEPIKIFAELIGYIFTLFFLFVIIPKLHFVTVRYSEYLPIAFWATTVATLFKVIKHASSLNAVKRIFEIGDNLVSVYSIYWLISIYPLDFARIGISQLNVFFRYALYIVIFALAVSILVNFIRIFFPERINS